MRGAFIHLKPADRAVIGKIFCDSGFRYAEMLSQLRFDGAAAARSASQNMTDGYAESLAGLYIVVCRLIGVGENPYPGTGWRLRCVFDIGRCTGEQTTKIHLHLRKAGGKTRVAGTATQAGKQRFSSGLLIEVGSRGGG